MLEAISCVLRSYLTDLIAHVATLADANRTQSPYARGQALQQQELLQTPHRSGTMASNSSTSAAGLSSKAADIKPFASTSKTPAAPVVKKEEPAIEFDEKEIERILNAESTTLQREEEVRPKLVPDGSEARLTSYGSLLIIHCAVSTCTGRLQAQPIRDPRRRAERYRR